MDATPSPLDAPVPAKKSAPPPLTPARIVLLVCLFVAVAALLFDLVARKRYNRAFDTVKNQLEHGGFRESQLTPERIHQWVGRQPDEPLPEKLPPGSGGREVYTYSGIFYRYQVVVEYTENGLYSGIEQKQRFIFGG